MFARGVRFRGEFHTRYSAVVALVGIKHAFDDDAGCGGGFTRVCQREFNTSDHVVSVYSNFPCATKW